MKYWYAQCALGKVGSPIEITNKESGGAERYRKTSSQQANAGTTQRKLRCLFLLSRFTPSHNCLDVLWQHFCFRMKWNVKPKRHFTFFNFFATFFNFVVSSPFVIRVPLRKIHMFSTIIYIITNKPRNWSDIWIPWPFSFVGMAVKARSFKYCHHLFWGFDGACDRRICSFYLNKLAKNENDDENPKPLNDYLFHDFISFWIKKQMLGESLGGRKRCNKSSMRYIIAEPK